jgi:hypothetical protein
MRNFTEFQEFSNSLRRKLASLQATPYTCDILCRAFLFPAYSHYYFNCFRFTNNAFYVFTSTFISSCALLLSLSIYVLPLPFIPCISYLMPLLSFSSSLHSFLYHSPPTSPSPVIPLLVHFRLWYIPLLWMFPYTSLLDRVHSQLSSCGTSGQSGTEAGLLGVLRFTLPILTSPSAPYSLFILWRRLYTLDSATISFRVNSSI